MGLLEFSKLPVNTLVGADWKTFKAITKDQHVDSSKKIKYHKFNKTNTKTGNRTKYYRKC